MKRMLVCFVLCCAAALLVAQQAYQLPVWNGKTYQFPRIGPSLAITNNQLDTVVPYTISATGDVDFGSRNITAKTITAAGTPPGNATLILITAGPPPANTCDTGTLPVCRDAAIFLDSSDLRLKMLKRSGDVVLIEMTPPPATP